MATISLCMIVKNEEDVLERILAPMRTAADEIIIADIFAARETDDGTVSAAQLADRIAQTGKSARYVGDFAAIEAYLREHCKSGDLLMTVGAGDVYKIGENFLK